MKRAVLFTIFGVALAGVASANVFTTKTASVAPQPPLREAAAPASPIAPPELPLKTSSKAVPVEKVEKNASVETRQAPVPMQTRHRPPVNLPAPDTKASEAKASPGGSDKPAADDSKGFSEAAAKAAIEADGYRGVTVLRKGVNGVWHASALRGKTTVMLTVDATGSVSAD
jgi:hypothetical protein